MKSEREILEKAVEELEKQLETYGDISKTMINYAETVDVYMKTRQRLRDIYFLEVKVKEILERNNE